MDRIFSPDNLFFRTLARGVDIVGLSLLWVLATSPLSGWQDALLAAFTAIVQGILCAGCSVYINQLGKQATKSE